MDKTALILIVVGTFLLVDGLLLLWIALRARSRRLETEIRQEISRSGETLVAGPQNGSYRGGTGTNSRVKGNGLLALTDRRLLFRKIIGSPIEVDLRRICRVETKTWYRGAVGPRRPQVVVSLDDESDIGFYVLDPEGWRELIAVASDQADGA